MTTIELINSQKCKKNFSFEVLPPLKGNGTGSLFNTIDKLKEFKPLFINITNHSSEYVYKEHHDGLLERTRIHRRPGTVAIAAAIQYKYNIPVMPHIICAGASRSDIEYELLDLQFLGIENLLVLRGDKAHEDKKFTPAPNGYSHATELIEQINQFNKGFFMDGSPIKNPGKPFDFGVACYPEKHEEAPNLDIDIRYLKQKQDLGAQYAVTQLFYDNEKYFDFVEKARQMGITIPIIPGIKPMAKLLAFGARGVEPKYMGLGPAEAIPVALTKAGVKFEDIDYFEVNEAFAAQFIGVERKLEQDHHMIVDRNKTNLNGSGISLGHPVGCSALRIVVTMLYEMQRQDAKLGLASLCVGGGPALASVWTRDF